MPVVADNPTPYPEVNALLRKLLASVQAILGKHLIGMYLDGSLASGDFDQESDIDFVVVTDDEISGDLFSALEAMHERVAAIDWPQVETGLDPKKYTLRTGPTFLKKLAPWRNYNASATPLRPAVERLLKNR